MQSDIELIASLRRKDDDSRSILFDEYGSDIYSLIYNMTSDSAISSEYTVKTFEAFEANKFNYDPKSRSIYGFLIKIARSLVRKAIQSEEINVSPESKTNTTLLNPNYSEILNSIFLNGQDLDKTAKTMRVPLSSVRTRLRLAINALAKKYNPETGQFFIALILFNCLLGI